MFTGLVTDVGRVRGVSRGSGPEGGIEAPIGAAYDSPLTPIGASIACPGPCLTVIAVEPGAFSVQASPEPLACSTLGDWEAGTPINLERALRVGDELGGHIVSGHVDGVARLVDRRPEGESVRLVIEAPAALMPYIAPESSVALHGLSLTLNAGVGRKFRVHIIPPTFA